MPSFTFDSAKKIYESLAPKPTPENPRIAAARKLLEKTPSAARDTVGAELIRQATDPGEVMAMHALVAEHLDDTAAKADEELATTVREVLATVDTRSPGEQVYDAAHDAGIEGEALDRVLESANRIDSQADEDDA